MMKERIQEEIKQAMKAKSVEKLSVLRGLLADIQTAEVAPGAKLPLVETEVVAILKRAIKRRKESIEAFRQGKREDLAIKEESEIQYIQPYLPKELGEEETRQRVHDVLIELKVTDIKQQGLVMKTVMGKYPGQLDGKLVSRLVGEALKK
ncbi:MAG: GatB/YqeY domain-containing protein [Planctomycetota bacterium]